jgi:hypothetical protein
MFTRCIRLENDVFLVAADNTEVCSDEAGVGCATPAQEWVQPATEERAGFLLPPTENRAEWDLTTQAEAPGGNQPS